ncbi:hypothetical protein OGATHE_005564 [Ogataea polymorpha]|uniref:Uncharacterized protein n=1 Tax=Ogataea polymorpha TaxID=460523 RepID=A0A9P8NUX2_9ASCO|nr:hypothetical protein OGATHE_005564 [Ogataea polymorpha]
MVCSDSKHRCSSVAAKDHTAHHDGARRALQVAFVGQPRLDVVGALVVVDRRVEVQGLGGVEDLENVKLAAARAPARAVGVGRVLRRARDVRVQKPDGGHVVGRGVLADAVFLRRAELEQEHLGGSVVAVVGRDAVSINTAVLAEPRVAARHVRHDDELLIGMQRHVAQHGALTSGRHAVRVDVVECFSEARDILTHVAEERHVVCGEVVGVVVCEPRPRAVGLAVGVVVGDIVSEFLQIYWASDVHRDLVVERRDRTFKTGRLVCVDLARARVVRARVDALHVVEIALEPKVLELQHSVLIRKDAWHLFDTVHALTLHPQLQLAQFTVPRTAYQGTHRWMNKLELLYKTVDQRDVDGLEELDSGLRALRSDQFDMQLERIEEVPEPGRGQPNLEE